MRDGRTDRESDSNAVSAEPVALPSRERATSVVASADAPAFSLFDDDALHIAFAHLGLGNHV